MDRNRRRRASLKPRLTLSQVSADFLAGTGRIFAGAGMQRGERRSASCLRENRRTLLKKGADALRVIGMRAGLALQFAFKIKLLCERVA
jgi:hypothetical protein